MLREFRRLIEPKDDWRELEDYTTDKIKYEINSEGVLRSIKIIAPSNSHHPGYTIRNNGKVHKSLRSLVHSVFEEHETDIPKPNKRTKEPIRERKVDLTKVLGESWLSEYYNR